MISTAELIQKLGYTDSPNFLSGNSLTGVPSLAHILRRAQEHCRLAGVYALRQDVSQLDGTTIPLVYVCEADSDEQARQIHLRVWNQDVVPFVIVRTPQNIRIYSGFAYSDPPGAAARTASAILNEAVDAHELATSLASNFHAERIDDGTLWRELGRYVLPEMRVDWRLLDNLEQLGNVLRDEMALPPQAAHALIGKYVYLRYLRDRNILSDQRLAEFQISEKSVFSRHAQLAAFKSLVEKLDDWLNGSVFDIPWSKDIQAKHIRQVAGAFFGDDPQTGQLNLYEEYNFAFIPIETLSIVYEQFLHSQGKAKDAGAYYTPIPLVNFILDELHSRHPLRTGLRVLDPACGSGAFLVQCYRRLIEKVLSDRNGRRFQPDEYDELADLLRDHIVGIDRDEDACQVTELSLILTLLDYVHPPDLTNTPFQLPTLRGSNIFGGAQEDFFNTESQFHEVMGGKGFDWIVGNPPWTEFSTEKPRDEDHYVAQWKNSHEKQYPTGGNQVAELFAWKVTEHLQERGKVGLLLPAMTLFKDESINFRKMFFRDLKVDAVANFANLAYVLFAGRSEVPAAAFFYGLRADHHSESIGERILAYAPLVINQESNRPARSRGKNVDTWNIVVNGAEIREVDAWDAVRGDGLTWKLAMWGSHRDRRLLESVAQRFSTLANLEQELGLVILEGFQLRHRQHTDKKVFVPELVGKNELVPNELRGFDCIFAFPPTALRTISTNRAYLRKRGGQKPLAICKPPHIVVQASRNYAVFSEEFLVVPPRQIGIAGSNQQTKFLKVLSLYLSSDFAQYHQFLTAPQWGVSFNRANLDTLKALPVPLDNLSDAELEVWLDLHTQLVEASPTRPETKSQQKRGERPGRAQKQFLFDTEESEEPVPRLAQLVRELNDRVYERLGLSETDRMLVEDFVHFKRFANKGKVGEEVAGLPDPTELQRYGEVLESELDDFFDPDANLHHEITVYYDSRSRTGMVEIHMLDGRSSGSGVRVEEATAGQSGDFERARRLAREKRSQWLYFERNLRIYEGPHTLLLKPLQRIHWLRSQALLDADTIIAESIAAGER